MTLRVIGYIRVSTNDQGKNGMGALERLVDNRHSGEELRRPFV